MDSVLKEIKRLGKEKWSPSPKKTTNRSSY
jgi:hypothetical protein